jgi:hypothetical protein
MMLRKFLAVAMTFTVFSVPAYASVVYDFTFDDMVNGSGIVDGTVTLPSSANGTYAASSVVVTSNTPGVGLGEYVGNPNPNTFLVSGGNITDADFLDFGVFNSPPAVVCCALRFELVSGVLSGDMTVINSGIAVAQNPVTFTLQAAPLPAALPLFVSGLGALGLLGWRRKRKAYVSLLGVA